jgi:outer membrane protein
MSRHFLQLLTGLMLALGLRTAALAASASMPPTGSWPTNALSLNEALEVALRQSPTILKGRQDIQESYGVSLQLKSSMLPRITGSASYQAIGDGNIESVQTPGFDFRLRNNQFWNANILVSQPIYAGGGIQSRVRAAGLTREAALAQFQAIVADALLSIKVAYDDVLLSMEQIQTQKASVALLEKELLDQKRRFDAGTAPRFNVLRAEVELANAKPRLIRAENAFRISRDTLATLLGWNIPTNAVDSIPLRLSGRLAAEPFDISLPMAIAKARVQRPELTVRTMDRRLKKEEVTQAQANYYPSVSIGGGYQGQSRVFSDDLALVLDGWTAGAQFNWSILDFGLTKGRVDAAKARLAKSEIDQDDTVRRIDLEVRMAHSTFIEAREVLDSQQKVIEQAEEAVRLAMARNDAGSGTQLDVLSAQTALTEARTTHAQALRDYAVALARLDRAMGDGIQLLANKL